jgi:hypothetical protein
LGNFGYTNPGIALDAGWPHEGKKSAAKKQKNDGQGVKELKAEASRAGCKELGFIRPESCFSAAC